MDSILLVEGVFVFGVGVACGYVVRRYVIQAERTSIEGELEEKILNAKKEARNIEDAAISRAHVERAELRKYEDRIKEYEERIRTQEVDVEKERDTLRTLKKELIAREDDLRAQQEKIEVSYETLSGLSRDDAKLLMIQKIEREHEEDLRVRMFKLARDGEARLEAQAKDILTNTIYRLANTNVSQFTTSTVEIDDPELKGKIIGKEGRNIKTFERLAGVELLVDEVPQGIVISCFDAVRRAIAKNALELLIKDGRIQPAKIEECIDKAKREIGQFIVKKGEEAVMVCGLLSIPDQLVPLIGRLYFRTSYGQNVLDHSIEMAHIAGMLAEELGADVHVAKAGALLHDIGKAVDHEIQGTHVEIGRKILAKYGIDERVILAMQSHHEEYPYETLESVIVQVADAISGGRPGARRDTVDRYIKRLEDLEAIALAFTGIERVYALQAGREIRVFVTPALVNDLQARDLARSIALRVEQELRFPGEIKISVIRESKVIDFAR